MRASIIYAMLVGIATALLSACSAPATPVVTPSGTGTTAAPVSIPTVTPTLATSSPYELSSAQLARLGPPTAPFVKSRQVILQRFVHGAMLIFAKSDKGFDSGSEYVLALANNAPEQALAWRSADTFVETSKMADNWYTCERAPGLRPEKSGIPWRGFGKVWCDHPEIRSALGNAAGYEEADINASFQDYARGRTFQLSEWRGIPGWSEKQIYVVYLDSTDPDFASGHWEEAER
jgi:hypothetical protein